MSIINKAILQTRLPLLEIKRFRGKINIQRPRPPHFARKLMIELTKPQYGTPKRDVPEIDLCDRGVQKWKKTDIENPFEKILAKECLNWFNHSPLIAFLHMNSINMEDKTKIYVALKKQNMHLRSYGKKIVSMATANTNYEAINHLFSSHNNIIFSQNTNIAILFRILKKAPQMILMAGIFQGQLLSRNELFEVSKMPNIETAQAQLCGVLQSAGSQIVSQLNQHQSTFVSHLDKHIELASQDNKNGES